jgi:hypothetical protein
MRIRGSWFCSRGERLSSSVPARLRQGDRPQRLLGGLSGGQEESSEESGEESPQEKGRQEEGREEAPLGPIRLLVVR